jgi:DNA-binding CsgD family transcriptional regulator
MSDQSIILHRREVEAINYLVEHPDAHDKEIAEHMGLAVHTAKIYLGRAMEKLGVRTRTGLVAKVLRARLEQDAERYRGLIK